MMDPSAEVGYRAAVVDRLSALLIGDLDEESPRMTILSVRDVTDRQDSVAVLSVNVSYSVRGQAVSGIESFEWREWVEYDDRSASSMAEGLATLVRTDLREAVAIRPPDRDL